MLFAPKFFVTVLLLILFVSPLFGCAELPVKPPIYSEESPATAEKIPAENHNDGNIANDISFEEPKMNEENGLGELSVGEAKYEDADLGISFVYQKSYENGSIILAKEGRKVVFYPEPDKFPDGWHQFIEVFKKDAGQSVEDVLKKNFFKTPEETNNCTVVAEKTDLGVQAEIQPKQDVYEKIISDGGDILQKLNNICNSNYGKTNGIRYFLFRDSSPEKYLFLDIGQDSLPADLNSIEF